jgi:DNA invertase Pin-like site-specific DNA recombinase
MKIGYARVSTQDQNLDMQLDALKAAGCDRIYTEKASGKRDDRPELQRCLDSLREGDSLVVYKLDRLGRSTYKLLELTNELEKMNVEFESIQDRIDTSTPVGKAMFRMLAVLAEMERDIIVERTQAGLKAARIRGRIGGRPATPKKDLERALKLYDSVDPSYSVPEIVEMTGISKATIYRALKKREVKAD